MPTYKYTMTFEVSVEVEAENTEVADVEIAMLTPFDLEFMNWELDSTTVVTGPIKISDDPEFDDEDAEDA